MPTSPALTLELSNDLELIAFARMVLRQFLPPLNEVQEPLYYGAVTEVITNAVQEHRRHAISTPVVIEVTAGSDPDVIVTDTGRGFDLAVPPVPNDQSGLGLLITRAVVPGITIHTGTTGTTVSLPFPQSTPPEGR